MYQAAATVVRSVPALAVQRRRLQLAEVAGRVPRISHADIDGDWGQSLAMWGAR
jgi:hypothetical protein